MRLEDESVWLTQKLVAELFQKDVRTINEHIQNIFEEGELVADLIGDGLWGHGGREAWAAVGSRARDCLA